MNEMAKNNELNPIVSTLRARFVDTARDKLCAIDQAIRAIDGSADTAHAAEMKRLAHSLKGMAGSFGFMSVTRISEAFEDYLAAAIEADAVSRDGAREYYDAMHAIISSGEEPDESETDTILAGLPAPAGTF